VTPQASAHIPSSRAGNVSTTAARMFCPIHGLADFERMGDAAGRGSCGTTITALILCSRSAASRALDPSTSAPRRQSPGENRRSAWIIGQCRAQHGELAGLGMQHHRVPAYQHGDAPSRRSGIDDPARIGVQQRSACRDRPVRVLWHGIAVNQAERRFSAGRLAARR